MTKTSRWRMAITFAVAYLMCVLAPPVALAFMSNAEAYHCLTNRHQHGAPVQAVAAKAQHASTHAHAAASHEHHAGAAHQRDTSRHSDRTKAGGEDVAVNCCGLFCVSAIPATVAPDIVPIARVVPAQMFPDRGIDGRGPDRIDRPPIALLPL